MDPREIVDAYLQGRIESWGVFRRLVRLGLSTATALAVAAALPAAVNAKSAGAIGEVAHHAQESPVLDLLLSHLASQLAKVEADGSVRPLAATLARIGGNNSNLLNCDKRVECFPVKLNYNDGINNFNGELVPGNDNLMLNISGRIGESNLDLFGIISPRDPASSNGRNIGKVDMNFVGNVGEVPLNFDGNLGSLNQGRILK
jgi:hypothetical protein